ncbi:aminopeptidase P family protein [Candidatus Woesearchaeota archaeon]|nr:MAG: aminopeptidase P family protein [Candidatus Woesearchaeota archaeon]
MKTPLVIIGSSEVNKDLLYATKFKCSSMAFVKTNKTYVIVSPLEYSRAMKQAKADVVMNADIFTFIKRYRKISMPSYTKVGLVKKIENMGVNVELVDYVFPERRTKSKKEINQIKLVQKINEKAMQTAIDIISCSKISSNYLYYKGKKLTSEMVRSEVEKVYIENDLISYTQPIIACGKLSALPHETGRGYVKPNLPIVLDFFPCSRINGYYSDMTRTVVRGKASKKIKEMYDAVRSVQVYALKNLKPGVNIKDFTLELRKMFKKYGFNTNLKKSEGFIHSLGHGVGLDVHEQPMGDVCLRQGDVYTVEPGLYYKNVGGVRLEDIVVVTSSGVKNLTSFPYILEI